MFECKFEAYISKPFGFMPAYIRPAKCIDTKPTIIKPVQDKDLCKKISKSKNISQEFKNILVKDLKNFCFILISKLLNKIFTISRN